MGEVLVALPFAAGSLDGLVQQKTVIGYSATPELRETFDLAPEADDEAERAALIVASVAALSQWGQRRVATASVRPAQLRPAGDRAHGEVEVRDLSASQVLSWFADDPDVDARAAGRAAAGLDIDEAWSQPEVAELLGHDLWWHDVAEPDDGNSAGEPRTGEKQED